MAYTNAVYYMDYVLGSDAARPAQNIVSSTFATPIQITIVGHGLVTGAIVTVAGHLVNTNANGDWKITWVDADNFTLDTSIGNGIGVATGTVTPFGGMSWADAWRSISGGVAGAIATHIAPGDIIRIAKSPDPVGIGNATWTNLSKTITLAAAGLTLPVCMCEAHWTAVNAVDCLASAVDWKEGAKKVKITEDATPGANEVQAYFATGVLDLHTYQKLSFWIKNEVAIADNTRWIIKLYTTADASGVACDEFIIPAIPSTGRWLPLTIAKTGGGNLNAAVASISICNGAGLPTASKYIYLDNIIACTTAGLNLQSLISKNGLPQGGTEGFYGIQSINGVTVLLDNDTNTLANAGRGYSGTTELIATYIRETIKTDMGIASDTAIQQIMDSGSLALGNIQYQGGYDTGLNTQIGETFFDGLNGLGRGIYLLGKSYITLNYLNVHRYTDGYFIRSSSYNNTITTLSNASNNTFAGVNIQQSRNNTIVTLSNANNNGDNGAHFSTDCYNNIIGTFSANSNAVEGVYFLTICKNNIIGILNVNNGTSSGLAFIGDCNNNTIKTLSTSGNGIGIINDKGVNYVYKATIAEAPRVSGATTYADSRIFSQQEGGVVGNNWIYTDGGLINSEANTRPGGLGLEWKLAISSSNRNSYYPLRLSIAKIAVVANKLVTFKAHLTKSHATDIAGYIVCKGGQIAGVPADVVATKANDVNPEQLTITFTPTEAGTVEIMAGAYYVAANGNVLVDTISIVQA